MQSIHPTNPSPGVTMARPSADAQSRGNENLTAQTSAMVISGHRTNRVSRTTTPAQNIVSEHGHYLGQASDAGEDSCKSCKL